MSKKKAGRPKGRKTEQSPIVTFDSTITPLSEAETTCPKCGSEKRTPFFASTVQKHRGVAPDMKPYTRIVRRRTKCIDCGRTRIVRTYEYLASDLPAALGVPADLLDRK